jgi:hypothetical protein
MSSLFASLGRDAPPGGAGLHNAKKADIVVFLKRLEYVYVVDHASEARMRRVCEAIDTDVGSTGKNLVFYLTVGFKDESGDELLKQVLSLGARPDVPNKLGKLPLEAALSHSKLGIAQALALSRPALVHPDDWDNLQLLLVSHSMMLLDILVRLVFFLFVPVISLDVKCVDCRLFVTVHSVTVWIPTSLFGNAAHLWKTFKH